MQVEDPPVSAYNMMRFDYQKLTRGICTWLRQLNETAGAISFGQHDQYATAAERNIDFAWVYHFTYDFLFLFLDLLQSRRQNKSAHMDLLFREFLPMARTQTANKVNYSFMSIMQVYYGRALHPSISDLYHALRTLPPERSEGPDGEGTNTGLDWFVEDLNCDIKEAVGGSNHVSPELVTKAVHKHRLLSTTNRGLMSFIHQGRKGPMAITKCMDTDVACIVATLNEKVGKTWKEATRVNGSSKFGLDTRASAAMLPWDAVARAMLKGSGGADEDIYSFVERHVKNLAPWHVWKA